MKTDKRKLGDKGERLASLYLFFHGYRILKRNYVSGKNEIDIIACTLNTLAFVEVKTRVYDSEEAEELRPPRYAVDEAKQFHTRECAEHFMKHYKTAKTPRMDVIEVSFIKGKHLTKTKIKHYKGAY